MVRHIEVDSGLSWGFPTRPLARCGLPLLWGMSGQVCSLPAGLPDTTTGEWLQACQQTLLSKGVRCVRGGCLKHGCT